MSKTLMILLGFIGGSALGVVANLTQFEFWSYFAEYLTRPFGQIFIRLILMVVVPLIFSALVLGVIELSQGKNVGQIAQKTLYYTFLMSLLSVFVGIFFVTVFQPGKISHTIQETLFSQSQSVEQIKKNTFLSKPIAQIIVELVPQNPIVSATRVFDGEIVAFMIFALIFGIALARNLESKAELQNIDIKMVIEKSHLYALIQDLYDVCMKIILGVLTLAPYAIFCIMFNNVYSNGHNILGAIVGYVLTVVAALLFHQFVVYGFLIKWIVKKSPFEIFKKCKSVYMYAFSTSSSNATLPYTIKTAEEELGISKQVARFVLTIGSTANQNGTALFEGITILFLAQVYNIELSFLQQIQVLIISILAGIGTAGVPGGSIPMLAIILQSLSIPVEGVGLIIGVDRFLDMCRTTINVSGDLVIALLVDKSDQSTSTLNNT